MVVEAVIFDVTNTLIKPSGQVPEGIIETVERLQQMGVKVIAAKNDGSASSVVSRLKKAGISVDLAFTETETKVSKGSQKWIDLIMQETGFVKNQLIYVGKNDQDMRTAANSRLFYIHAEWSTPRGIYGIPAPKPQWVAAVVQHIFRKKHRWWWMLDCEDDRNLPVRKRALINGDGAGDDELKQELISAIKDNNLRKVGPMSLKTFVLLHLMASMYEEGLFLEPSWWWANYPSRNPNNVSPMKDFLETASKLFHHHYQEKLFIRANLAMHSRDARKLSFDKALENQLTTVQLNPDLQNELFGRVVLVVDDFITAGPTTEVARNLLMAANVSEAIFVAVGKYGHSNKLVTISGKGNSNWSPFETTTLDAISHGQTSAQGTFNPKALEEFLASYRAMETESW